MSLLDEDELDQLQQDIADIFEETMPDLLFIERAGTVTRDSENPEIIVGTNSEVVYDDVPCEYRQANPREVERFGLIQKEQLISITIAPIYDIEVSDTGQIFEKGNQAAIDFKVVGVLRESNATDILMIAEVV